MTSKVVALEKVSELSVMPSDIAKLVCQQDIIMHFSNEELRRIRENVDLELNYRDNKRWAQ